MSKTSPGRSHTRAVVLILTIAAVMVASASALALWVANRQQGARVVRSRDTTRADKDRHDTRNPDRTNTPNDSDKPKTPDCGAVQPWDVDGDGISDRVERNNSAFHGFDSTRCDRDPSAATGQPAGGALLRGVNLVDEGDGYVHLRGTDPVDTDDWATLALVNCLEAVGREAKTLDVRLTVNDLSRRPGGRFQPHRSHQNGLDVDVRYVRRDGRVAPLDIRQSPGAYDAVLTQALMQSFIRQCDVSVIFADLPSLNFTNDEVDRPVLVQAPGHTNHFHVRLRGPS